MCTIRPSNYMFYAINLQLPYENVTMSSRLLSFFLSAQDPAYNDNTFAAGVTYDASAAGGAAPACADNVRKTWKVSCCENRGGGMRGGCKRHNTLMVVGGGGIWVKGVGRGVGADMGQEEEGRAREGCGKGRMVGSYEGGV